MDPPDFGAIERTIVARLFERGLAPQVEGHCIRTGVAGLTFERRETQAVVGVGSRVYGHAEFIAELDHGEYGRHTIGDLVSLDAETAEAMLTACAELYVTMTLDALLALLLEDRLARPGLRVTSLVEGGSACGWDLHSGVLDIRGPDAAALDEVFDGSFPMFLVANTVAGLLAEQRLHWFKLYGEQSGATAVFGCIIDGHKAVAAEAEMRQTLILPPEARWSIRSFAVMVPHGDPDPAEVALMQADLDAHPEPLRRSWWPFGGKPGRRVAQRWRKPDEPGGAGEPTAPGSP